MIIVAFHYRLQTDKHPQLQGCWKEFSNPSNAVIWLQNRRNKTLFSPQGAYVQQFRSIKDVPEKYEDWDFHPHPESVLISLERSIRAFINYCNRKKKMLKDAEL